MTLKVISNKKFVLGNGYLYVNDPYTLIRNSSFTSTAATSNTSAMIQTSGAVKELRLENVEIVGGPAYNRGVQSDTANITVIGSRFKNTGEAAVEKNDRSGKTSFTVKDSFVAVDKGWPRGQHVDGLQVGGAGAVTITHNTVLIPSYGDVTGDTSYVSNSALGLWAELGNVTGPVLVQNNLLGGGGFTMYLEAKSPFKWLGSVSVLDNVFDTRFSDLSGIWGVLYPGGRPSQLVFENNLYSNGSPVTL